MRSRLKGNFAGCGIMLALFLVSQTVAPACLEAQVAPDDEANEIISPSPLHKAAVLLEERYGKPVTFEEPVWQWRGDVTVRGRDENAPMAQWLKERRFLMPDWLTPERTPHLDVAVLGRMLDAYHAQNEDGARFKVLESRLGLHIVPTQSHNAEGQLVPASSLLDFRISVPTALRMASGHFKALRAAITAASGTQVQDGSQWLDVAYAANGITPPRGAAETLPEQEKERYCFSWGVSDVSAREALLLLIDQSATTLVWQLLCQPSAKAADRFCVLNLTPLVTQQIGPDGRVARKPVYFDRRVAPRHGPALPLPQRLP